METQELSNATLTDIVFDNRNKDYGAFKIRKTYVRNVFIALGIASVIFAAFFLVNLADAINHPPMVKEEKETVDTVAIVDVPIEPAEVKPDLAVVVEPPNIEKVKFTAYVEVPDEQATEPIKSNEELEQKNLSETDQKGKDTIVADGGGDELATKVDEVGKGTDEDAIYVGPLDKHAKFPGGMEAFSKFVNSNLSERTRDFVRDRAVKGKMFVTITVGQDGKVIDAEVAKGKELKDCALCNEELPGILKKMPAWEPAESNGYKRKVKFMVPVIF
jgi:protein TonB